MIRVRTHSCTLPALSQTNKEKSRLQLLFFRKRANVPILSRHLIFLFMWFSLALFGCWLENSSLSTGLTLVCLTPSGPELVSSSLLLGQGMTSDRVDPALQPGSLKNPLQQHTTHKPIGQEGVCTSTFNTHTCSPAGRQAGRHTHKLTSRQTHTSSTVLAFSTSRQ